ncbi:MAG: RHS repeat-associated core domain-containing protein [Limisphaerales bacterium]
MTKRHPFENQSRSGTFTLSGATPAPVTNITVNGNAAQTYGDFTFASTNNTLTNGNNTFTIIAQNAYGTNATNILTVNLPSSVTLGFDANGNLTNDGTRSFAYDSENQLTNVFVAGQWQSSFVYDGLNRRRIERDYSWQSGAWVKTNEVYYIYDGYLPVQERDTNNNVLVTYTRGLDLSSSLQGAGGIGGLLARTDGNGSTYYHADANENITALMDGNENIVARYMYGPFGRLIRMSGVMGPVNEMQFSSMPEHDGLTLYPFRGYDPNLQRFLNQDPIGENGGINLYRAMNNNPLNEIDPLGLFGGDADANPGGVNGVPFMNITYDPCSGKSNVSNNDDPLQLLLIALAPLIGPAALAGLAGPDEEAAPSIYDTLANMGEDAGGNANLINREVTGGDANQAFNDLVGDLEQTTEKTPKGPVTSVQPPEGGSVSVRPFSKTGPPTIQGTPPTGPRIKVRFP